MKKVLLFIVLIVISINTFSQSFEFTNSHTALHVKDVNLSAKFYNEIMWLPEMETPKGIPETIRWFYLNDNSQVHLIQSNELVKIPKGIHLSFATKHLDGFIKHLIKFNIPFENWYGEKSTTNTRGDNVKQIYIQDPDGYWIEINDDLK
ncbi:VOC family protein [Urechidicola croceus]|uniref:VOC domain-containing protein n=1 Tax=Urechidicola croceus TaxID=1850246 RepID=A0A1D8P3P7_9FLAO|nr:VOC family protein [Urechidicola croceus]AOW19184.1 hypothetical protein LPB138_00105 [Urechidicola croceus]